MGLNFFRRSFQPLHLNVTLPHVLRTCNYEKSIYEH